MWSAMSRSDMNKLKIPVTDGDVALLKKLRDGVPRTRSELASYTGFARSTIASRLSDLMDARLVVPAGEAASSGGRPASQVVFNPLARILIAIDLGATHGIVAIADLAGGILAHASSGLDITAGPQVVLDGAVRMAQDLLRAVGRDIADLAGIGIGVPGPVEHATGIPTRPPIMPGWDRFDVPAYVQKTFPVPVFVDNDVNILALGERATIWQNYSELLFVKVATGIGAGIISGGRLQRGALGSAGDLGHVFIPSPDGAGMHHEGGVAELESVASGPAIAASLRKQGIDATTNADIVELARRSDPTTTETLRQAGRALGTALATCVNLLNPSIIVLGGSIGRAGDHLIAGVREIVYRQSTPLATQQLRIVSGQSGTDGGVLGAAIMVSDYILGLND